MFPKKFTEVSMFLIKFMFSEKKYIYGQIFLKLLEIFDRFLNVYRNGMYLNFIFTQILKYKKWIAVWWCNPLCSVLPFSNSEILCIYLQYIKTQRWKLHSLSCHIKYKTKYKILSCVYSKGPAVINMNNFLQCIYSKIRSSLNTLQPAKHM